MAHHFQLKKLHFILCISAIILLMCLFVIFSTDVKTHDGSEYQIFMKHFIGINNIKPVWIHSNIYPIIGAVLLKLYPSLQLVRLLGVAILALIGYLLWKNSKSQQVVILWFISPVIWAMNGSIYPAIMGTLFLFLAYIYWKKYEHSKRIQTMLFSGLLLGIAGAIAEVIWPIMLFFVIIFLYKKSFGEFLFFLLSLAAGFSTKLITDYFIFGYPHFSLFRYIGANIIVFLGLHPENIPYSPSIYAILGAFVLISPLLILLYKLYGEGLKQELYFLAAYLLFILFIFTGSGDRIAPHYLLPIAPIAISHLGRILSKKQFIVSVCLCLPLIIVYSLQGIGEMPTPFQQDVDMFLNEFNYDNVIADRNLEQGLAAEIWNNRPYILWLDEYLASKTGDKVIKTYTFEEAPLKKFNNFKIARLSFGYLANVDKEYPDNLPFLANKGAKLPLEGYKQVKCYQTICVYEKAIGS